MITVNYSTLRGSLKEYCDKAVEDSETIIVTRKAGKDVVLISLEEYGRLASIDRIMTYLEKL